MMKKIFGKAISKENNIEVGFSNMNSMKMFVSSLDPEFNVDGANLQQLIEVIENNNYIYKGKRNE